MAASAVSLEVSAPAAIAQDMHLRVHCVNLHVRDQERSLCFYRDQLGFRVAYDVRMPSGQRWVAVGPPDGSTIFALLEPTPGTPEHKLIGRATQVVLVTDDVAARFREWSKRGVKFPGLPRLRRVKFDPESSGASKSKKDAPAWGSVQARFLDPDGNSFTLMSFDLITMGMEKERREAAERLAAERRAAEELEIAVRVQSRLFPQTLPKFKTLECAGLCIPARKVGGDYYDVLHLGRDRFGLIVGDVVGKGIAAALLMANLQAVLRSQCAIAFGRPRQLLQAVNRLFSESAGDGSFATLFFAEYDDNKGRLRYANCGHLPALLVRANGDVEYLRSTATVVGLLKNWDCDIEERDLRPGDALALYTDGVTEAFSSAGEEYGEERLTAALRRHRERPPRELLDAIVGEVRKFSSPEQHDDITLIVAKRHGKAAGKTRR